MIVESFVSLLKRDVPNSQDSKRCWVSSERVPIISLLPLLRIFKTWAATGAKNSTITETGFFRANGSASRLRLFNIYVNRCILVIYVRRVARRIMLLAYKRHIRADLCNRLPRTKFWSCILPTILDLHVNLCHFQLPVRCFPASLLPVLVDALLPALLQPE